MSPGGTRLSGPGRVCLGSVDFIPVGPRGFKQGHDLIRFVF